MTTTPKPLNRRNTHRGATVKVVTRDERTFTGTLEAWGQFALRLRDTDGNWHEFAAQVVRVYPA